MLDRPRRQARSSSSARGRSGPPAPSERRRIEPQRASLDDGADATVSLGTPRRAQGKKRDAQVLAGGPFIEADVDSGDFGRDEPRVRRFPVGMAGDRLKPDALPDDG